MTGQLTIKMIGMMLVKELVIVMRQMRMTNCLLPLLLVQIKKSSLQVIICHI